MDHDERIAGARARPCGPIQVRVRLESGDVLVPLDGNPAYLHRLAKRLITRKRETGVETAV
jgi:hypothetical protein